MPTLGSTDHQVFTPADSEAVNAPLSDAGMVDYSELKTRKGGRTAEERVRLHQYRLRAASGYADHHFPPAAPEEPEPQAILTGKYAGELQWTREHTYTCFTNSPDAFVLRRLPRGRSVQHVLPRTAARTAARPRQRRDGSRRHSTRGGTGDDPAPSSDSDEGPPPPNDGRRFCACGCGADISHKRAGAKVLDATHRKRKQRHPETPGAEGNPYLTLPAWEREALKDKALCRCNGSHVLDAEFGDCVKCGRRYRDPIPPIPPYYLKLWELRDSMPSYTHAVAYDQLYGVMA